MPPESFIERARALSAARATQGESRLQQVAETVAPTRDKPMSVWWLVCLLVAAGIADFIDLSTGGTIGWVIGLFVDLVLVLVLGRSNIQKSQIKKMWIGMGLETVLPVADILPFRTVSVLWAYFSSRR